MYERWSRLQDAALLEDLEEYSRVDCISTLKLRDWLIGLRPPELPWYTEQPPDPKEAERTADREEAERRTAHTVAELMKAPEAERDIGELIGQLLDFHKREAKPGWWFQISPADMTLEDLIEDAECIGGLERDASRPPFPEKRSMVHTFLFQPQDFK